MRTRTAGFASTMMATWIKARTTVRFVAAGLLLNAAVLKLMGLSTPWTIPVILFELLLGAMLIGNFLTRIAWALAMMAFGIFAAVALWKSLAGNAQCGCLGNAIEVPPQVMFVVDMAILGSLALTRGCKELDLVDRLIQRPLFVPMLIGICLPSAGLMYMQHRADSTLVAVEPAAWLGNSFPLQLDTDANDRIQIGSWTVVLYRSGCGTCEHLFASEDMDRLLNAASLMAYVELPPYSSSENAITIPPACTRGRVTSDAGLSLPAPLIVDLENGTVVRLRTFRNDQLAAVSGA